MLLSVHQLAPSARKKGELPKRAWVGTTAEQERRRGRGRRRSGRRESCFACSEGSVVSLQEGLSLFSLLKLERIRRACSVYVCVCMHVPVCHCHVSLAM